jgi:hypothetical protein
MPVAASTSPGQIAAPRAAEAVVAGFRAAVLLGDLEAEEPLLASSSRVSVQR